MCVCVLYLGRGHHRRGTEEVGVFVPLQLCWVQLWTITVDGEHASQGYPRQEPNDQRACPEEYVFSQVISTFINVYEVRNFVLLDSSIQELVTMEAK